MRLHNIRFNQISRTLTRHFGCNISIGKGDHYVFRRIVDGETLRGAIPYCREIKTGTLSGILKRLDIDRSEFESLLDD